MKFRLIPSLLASAFAATGTSWAEDDAAELAKQLSNPVSSLISVPFQANWDFRMGPLDAGTQFKLNFQPVVPVSLSKEWNLIIRTIVPYISQEDVYKSPIPSFPGLPENVLGRFPGAQRDAISDAAEKLFNKAVRKRPVDRHQDGLGDIVQSFFFSPKEPIGGMILGAGPVLLYPTATDDLLGSEKWGAGPTLVALRQQGPWTYGVLANHLWSFAGNDERENVNATFVQPFLAYNTKTHTTISLNAEATYDWNDSQWVVPLNLGVAQLFKIGSQPMQFQIGGRYYAEGPSGAPEWGLRCGFTLLFPTGKKSPAAPSDGKGYAK